MLTQFPYCSIGFYSTSSCIYPTFSFHCLKIATRFKHVLTNFQTPGVWGGAQVPRHFLRFLRFDLVSSAFHDISCIFSFHFPMVFIPFPVLLISSVLHSFPAFSHVFCSHFLCLPWHFLPVHRIFYVYFLRFTLFSCIFPCFCSHFLCLPWHFLPFHRTFYAVPAFSYVSAFISSAYHDISCHFTVCSRFISSFLHFRMFLLISSAYDHISCLITVFSTVFIASLFSLFPAFYACIFPCFWSDFLCLPSHFLHFHILFYDFY